MFVIFLCAGVYNIPLARAAHFLRCPQSSLFDRVPFELVSSLQMYSVLQMVASVGEHCSTMCWCIHHSRSFLALHSCVCMKADLLNELRVSNESGQLYVLATGVDKEYPGIAGCTKSGCGGPDNKAKVGSDENKEQLLEYFDDLAWMFSVSMAFMVFVSFTGDIINTILRVNAQSTIQRRLLTGNKLMYRLTGSFRCYFCALSRATTECTP